jgi:hypothetical protein
MVNLKDREVLWWNLSKRAISNTRNSILWIFTMKIISYLVKYIEQEIQSMRELDHYNIVKLSRTFEGIA